MQYLINATAIWLISLLVYDVLLRRETYHAYNRAYLLITLLSGTLIPLLPVHYADVANTTPVLQQSLQQVTRAKTAVSELAVTPQHGWTDLLLYLYAFGSIVALAWLIVDILKLIRVHRSGTCSVQDGWTVIETGKEQAPFSFGNTLYVCRMADYAPAEWNMLSAHERRHHSLLHMADLILLYAARIVFWFHPLVYIYHRRLLMVHEYQADSVAVTQPAEYGHFLIEQAVLNAAPAITHSINRSPIKKRILMLTRTSHSIAGLKKLVVLPLLAISILYCSFACIAQSKKKNLTTTFANSSNGRTTYKAILADPNVKTSRPGCSVAYCTISFVTKGNDYLGPFKCPGGKMHEKLINYLKTYKEENMRIFIEDIKLTCNGTIDSTEMPLLITAKETL